MRARVLSVYVCRVQQKVPLALSLKTGREDKAEKRTLSESLVRTCKVSTSYSVSLISYSNLFFEVLISYS